MIALPSNVPVGVFPVVLVGDLLVFVLIGLTFRLLGPRAVSGGLWVGPIFHLYTLAAVLLALFEAIKSQPLLAVMPAFGTFVIAAGIGAVIGAAVGRRIPVSKDAGGKVVFTGGRLLVGLVVGLLAPLALEQAIVLIGALASVQSLLRAITGAFPFDYILLVLGFLFVLGTFLSLAWRAQVWAKRGSVRSH
ncbi:MAG: hypothetical protein WAK40_03310 [Thermoplasmata archaeon]